MEQSSEIAEYFFEGAKQLSLDIARQQYLLIERYLRELMVWNEKVNLTGASNVKDLVVKHVLDSLLPLKLLSRRHDKTLLDVGSGAGFPGIPLKICLSHLEVVLLEPNSKKASFLTHMIGQLQLKNTFAERKTLKELIRAVAEGKTYDVVTSRALNPRELLQSVKRLLPANGALFLYRASPLADRVIPASLRRIGEIDQSLPFDSGQRVLTILGVA